MTIELLNPGSPSEASNVGVRNARIFGNLAEEILAINRLQPTPKEGLEFDASGSKHLLLSFADPMDHVFRAPTARVSETFRDAVGRTGTGNDEVAFGMGKELSVVKVDRVLKRQEGTDPRIAEKQSVDILERRRLTNPVWQAIVHHARQQCKMVCVLALMTKRGRRHNVCSGIDLGSAIHHAIKRLCKHIQDPNQLEKALAEFEGEMAPALERVKEAKSLAKEEDRAHLVNLMAALALRNPSTRQAMRHIHDQLARLHFTAQFGTQVAIDEAIAAGILPKAMTVAKLQQDLADASFPMPKPLIMAFEIDMHDPVTQKLWHRKWQIVVATEGTGGFVTTDDPVCLLARIMAQCRLRNDWQLCRLFDPLGSKEFSGSTIHAAPNLTV